MCYLNPHKYDYSSYFLEATFMENPPAASEPPHCIIPIHKPKRREYLFFFISGIVVSIPFAVFFESLYPTSSVLSSAILIVVLAPIIEELAKVFPLFYRHGETERSIVTLGLLLGLGFGIAEFTQYVFCLVYHRLRVFQGSSFMLQVQ